MDNGPKLISNELFESFDPVAGGLGGLNPEQAKTFNGEQ